MDTTFSDKYIQPILQGKSNPTDEILAKRYGFTPGKVAGLLCRARKDCRKISRSIVGSYAKEKSDIDDDLNYLIELSSKAPDRLVEVLAKIWKDEPA